MSADIVERSQFTAATFNDEERIPSHFITRKISRIGEAVCMGDLQPFLGEYSTPFRFIELGRMVPRGGESPLGECFLFFGCCR